MNWKHLFWIIPLTLILGILIGFKTIKYTIDTLDDMVNKVNSCSMQTLQYVSEKNSDCQILVSGFLRNCTNIQDYG